MSPAAGEPGGRGPLGVALLGSTGSIGRQTVDVIRAAGPDAFRVVALAAGRDAATLAEQARALRPAAIALADSDGRRALGEIGGAALIEGDHALVELAVRDDVDLVVVATGGVISLRPVLAALEAGKVVATANKETLVIGGHLVMPLARARAQEVAARDPASPLASPLAWLRPIDSEHSAIWQCLVGEDLATVRRLILTASGGPFRDWPAARLRGARPSDALAHPTWDMGAKITIDSATLMNKGLEVLEARWLYDVADERIDILVHPQSLIHSLVEFVDGSVKAQLGLPDMRIPIQYAMSYPIRRPGPAPRLDLVAHPSLTFDEPDVERFPALAIARAAGRDGPRASAALVAADDIAVERFLGGGIGFTGIAALAAAAVERFGGAGRTDADALDVLHAEVRAWARMATVEGSVWIIADGILNILILLAILVGLVLVHEIGHFVTARRAGVKVHEFGIGFPPRAAILYRGRETTYTLNWLPIGGFVRLEGEEGESVDPRAFVNQRLRTRVWILVAGVAINFIVAWLIFTSIAMLADPVMNVRVGSVAPGSPAAVAGIVGGVGSYLPGEGVVYDDSGDVILAIDGQRFPVFDGMAGQVDASGRPPPLQYLADRPGETVVLTVRHADGSVGDLDATLNSAADIPDKGALGIRVVGLPQEDVTRGPLEAAAIGLVRTFEASTLILRGVAELLTNLANPPVAGPVGIVGIVGEVRSELPPVFLIWLVGLLSANLAVVNALPFPPMDGGRIAVALVKAASGNRVSPATERAVYLTGFVALMALLVWVTFQDIGRLVG